MLDVLLESKAPHTRRIGGTLASTLVHGAIITAAVVLTVQEGPHISIKDPPPAEIIYKTRLPDAPPPEQQPATPREPVLDSPAPSMPMPTIETVPTTIAPVDPTVGPITSDNLRIGPAVTPGEPAAGPPGAPIGTGEAMDVRVVDKPPRVLRSENPRFPEALRARGQNGRIVVQFVVDTLGRAEMSEFKVVDATDAQLADAVRAVLPRFRFTPGEAAGRKVRTMVALPFDFTLVR